MAHMLIIRLDVPLTRRLTTHLVITAEKEVVYVDRSFIRCFEWCEAQEGAAVWIETRRDERIRLLGSNERPPWLASKA